MTLQLLIKTADRLGTYQKASHSIFEIGTIPVWILPIKPELAANSSFPNFREWTYTLL